MGKWLVVYSSVTGNTKKVAEAMAQAAKEADLFSVDEVPEDLSGYEVVLAGYWLRRGGPDPKMARFLPRVAGRQVVFFQTHGTMPGTEHAVTAFARAALLLGEGCSILGTFSCQGKINPVLIEKRKKAGPEDPHANSAENAARWAAAANHPDTRDLQAAADFVQGLYRKLLLRARFAEKQSRPR